MTTDIQLLRSSVADKRPTPTSLLDGQPAVNISSESPGLFFKMTNGDLAKVGPATITTDGSTPNSAPKGSIGNSVAEEWIDARTAFASPILKLYQSDVLGWKAAHGFDVDDVTGDQSLDRKLTLRTMVANGTGVDSYIQVPAGPASDQSLIGTAGMIRVETDEGFLNFHDGTQWWPLQNRGGDAMFSSLIVTGNTTLGNDCSDLLNIVSTTTVACDLTMLASGLYFEAAGSGSNRIGFTAPPVLSNADTTFILPDGDGTNEQVLSTDGAGQLGWISREGVPSGAANDTEVFFDDQDVIRGTPLLRINKNTPSISVAANILPDAAALSNLGEAGSEFGELHTGVLTATAASIDVSIDVLPNVDNTLDLGSSTLRFGELHTGVLTATATSIDVSSSVLPNADSTLDLGSPTLRFANVYTGDLHLANDRGDWTVIEEEDYLSLRNNKSGKVFRLVMEEVS